MARPPRALSLFVVATLAAAAWPSRARADDPPAAAAVEIPAETHDGSAAVEPPVSHPPWSGREAIWGGVGLVIAGVATLIVVAPALCTSSLFSSGGGVGASADTSGSRTTCVEATVGGGAGGAALGGILVAVGLSQRSTYKTWLRHHPMFGGLSITPTAEGPGLGYRLTF